MAEEIINGIEVRQLGRFIHRLRRGPELGRFQFRVRNRWLERGGHSQSTVRGFYGAGEEQNGRRFRMEADEPKLLLGEDAGPNPVEYLLGALASCLTGALVYHAAARGIRIESCECELTGELDARGFLGIAPEVRKGYQSIEVRFKVKSDGTREQLEECARFSPVLDVVMHGTEVELDIENIGEQVQREEPSRVQEEPRAT